MGLFKVLGKIVSEAAKAVGAVIGSAVEKVGQALNNDVIENWGAELRTRCQFGSTQWNDTADVVKTVDVHKELEKVKQSIAAQAKDVEEDLIGECISEVKEAIDSILPLVFSPRLQLLSRSYAEEIHSELADLIMEYINPKLSMDDSACTKVLNILDDQERLEASQRYQDSVLSGAVRSFKNECIRVKLGYILQIVHLAESGLEDQECECQRLDQMIKNRLENAMNESQIDMAREQILIDMEKLALVQSLSCYQTPVDPALAKAKRKAD